MAEYRVEQLAAEAGVTVELLRSYQSKGLLPAPRHEGRIALYGHHHLERLRTIRQLKDQGYSLRAIARLLEPDLGGHLDLDDAPEESLDLRELAERSRVPPSMLRSLEASGVLRPRRVGDEVVYTGADVRAVRMLLSLVGTGMPMDELLRVAHVQLEAVDRVAAEAAELFLRYGRAPLQASGLPSAEEAERLADAFRLMLHAATSLLAYNFQRALLNAAEEAVEREGSRAERLALRRELARRGAELVMPA